MPLQVSRPLPLRTSDPPADDPADTLIDRAVYPATQQRTIEAVE